jgi:hypothetical protein
MGWRHGHFPAENNAKQEGSMAVDHESALIGTREYFQKRLEAVCLLPLPKCMYPVNVISLDNYVSLSWVTNVSGKF